MHSHRGVMLSSQAIAVGGETQGVVKVYAGDARCCVHGLLRQRLQLRSPAALCRVAYTFSRHRFFIFHVQCHNSCGTNLDDEAVKEVLQPIHVDPTHLRRAIVLYS